MIQIGRKLGIIAVIWWASSASWAGETPLVTIEPRTVKPGDYFVITVQPGEGEMISRLRASVLGFSPKFHEIDGDFYGVAAVGTRAPSGCCEVDVKMDVGGREFEVTQFITIGQRNFPRQLLTAPKKKRVLLKPKILLNDGMRINAAIETTDPRPLWHGSFLQAVEGRITTKFGTVRSIDGKPGYRHLGVDIAAKEGTPIKATNAGRVVLAEELTRYGNTVVIDHGVNVFSVYLHLSLISVSVGDEVKKGGIIGDVGSTGFVTGAHLHWTMRVGKIAVRPWNFIKVPPLVPLSVDRSALPD